MTDETTSQLVRRAKAGEVAAFGKLVERFQDMAAGYALARLRDPDRALDAAQEAFTDAYLHLQQLREEAAFPGWLRRIVHKHCDRQTRRYQPPSGGDPDELSGKENSPEEQLEAEQLGAWLKAAIESLPAHERLVVALHYFGDTAQQEAADFLELPLSTVKKRLFSARTRIRQWRTRMPMPMPDHHLEAMRPSQRAIFADRIQLFLEIRAGDRQTVGALLTRRPELIDAAEVWTEEEALEAGLPLAHRLTPLILAASRRDRVMVRLLLERGADPGDLCGCENGETALWAAVRGGATDVAETLLAAGANPDATNAKGHSALHVAAMRGRTDLVKMLLAKGATRTLVAGNGMTAADWGKAHGHHEVVRALTGESLQGSPRPTIGADHFETGIKAIDLLVPLRRGDIVRVHGAAETGLMVLLSELSRRFADAGGKSVWATWEVEPWQANELDSIAAEAGIEQVVVIVKAGHGDRSGGGGGGGGNVVERALAKVQTLQDDDTPIALFVFEAEGHAAEVEAALHQLAMHAHLVFVIKPWAAVTRGELSAEELRAPYDALICTDPKLARSGLYPAIHPQKSRSSAAAASPRHERVDKAVRTLLAFYGDATHDGPMPEGHDAPTGRPRVRSQLVRAFLSQPFFVAEHQTGYRAESVCAEDTLRGLERILRGELDEVPEAAVRYLGRLPDDLRGLAGRR